MRSPIFCLALLLSLLPIVLAAQNRLVRADDAVELQRVWTWIGESEDEVGEQVAALPDISGDGVGDLGVYRGGIQNWFFFRGGDPIEQEHFWQSELTGPFAPVSGNFLGGSDNS